MCSGGRSYSRGPELQAEVCPLNGKGHIGVKNGVSVPKRRDRKRRIRSSTEHEVRNFGENCLRLRQSVSTIRNSKVSFRVALGWGTPVAPRAPSVPNRRHHTVFCNSNRLLRRKFRNEGQRERPCFCETLK